ncbi:hypothetical protein WMY93_015872 [Mugilogobius chulae]|uniref:Uncharacterized protein n=1 Tax=Mugilogobius chulae TaxID=88201 RepID=A0AAW0P2J1_9GOBI
MSPAVLTRSQAVTSRLRPARDILKPGGEAREGPAQSWRESGLPPRLPLRLLHRRKSDVLAKKTAEFRVVFQSNVQQSRCAIRATKTEWQHRSSRSVRGALRQEVRVFQRSSVWEASLGVREKGMRVQLLDDDAAAAAARATRSGTGRAAERGGERHSAVESGGERERRSEGIQFHMTWDRSGLKESSFR